MYNSTTVCICWLIWTIQRNPLLNCMQSSDKWSLSDRTVSYVPLDTFTIIMCIWKSIHPVNRFIRLITSLIPMHYTFNISPEELIYFAYSIQNSILSYRFNSPSIPKWRNFANLFRCHFKQFVLRLELRTHVHASRVCHLLCQRLACCRSQLNDQWWLRTQQSSATQEGIEHRSNVNDC